MVDVPCPSGKHQRSLLTFRNHTVAAMFCIPCEYAWTEATTHPELLNMPLDRSECMTPKAARRVMKRVRSHK